MKSNKVLVALIGCMLTFSGTSFASDTSSGAMSNYLNSWFNAKRAALGSWAAEQPKELKSWATGKYRYLTGETEREQREMGQVRQSVNYFVEAKEFSTPLSKIHALKNVRDFFAELGSEKVEKKMVLEACNEKLAEMESAHKGMLHTKKEKEYEQIMVPAILKNLGITKGNLVTFSRADISRIYQAKSQDFEDYRRTLYGSGSDFTSIELQDQTRALKELLDQMPR